MCQYNVHIKESCGEEHFHVEENTIKGMEGKIEEMEGLLQNNFNKFQT